MAAKAAKDALDNVVTEYRRCIVLVKRGLSATPVNRRALSSKMKALSEASINLNTHHTAWVTKAGLDDTQLEQERYSVSWLEL